MLEALFQNSFFIQALGFIAFGLGVTALLSHDDRKLRILMTAQCLTLAIHFILLGASAAAIAVLISAVRNYVSLYARNRKHLALVFIALYLILGHNQYQDWVDLLPIIGCIISTIGFFYLKDIPMRLFMLATTFLWIIHNGISISIGPFLMEVCMFIANARTIMVLSKKKATAISYAEQHDTSIQTASRISK